MRPEINGGAFEAVNKISNQVLSIIDNHLSEMMLAEVDLSPMHVATNGGLEGISTSAAASSKGIWVQGFGFTGEQDKRKSVDGYNVDSYGFALGADTLVSPHLRLGGALSYGQSNVEDKGVNLGNKADIDSYQAIIYGAYVVNNFYLNGSLGLAKHDFDSKRVLLGNAVKGSHNAWQYIAKVDGGIPMAMGKATFIPVASLTYSYLDEDSYTEKGLGALSVNGKNTDSFRSGLGAKAIVPFYQDEAKAALELRAIWNHEFADTAQDSTARFAAGGSSFSVNGVSPARDSANLGATLRLTGGNAVKQTLLLSYDAEVKDQFVSHTGKLTARFDF